MIIVNLNGIIWTTWLIGGFLIWESESKINYESYDTIVLEGKGSDNAEKSRRIARNVPNGEGASCTTSTGLFGTCESVQECFPRLFPFDDNQDDSPKGIGVYNQNLAGILIEKSGFCGPSLNEVQDVEAYDAARLQELRICCASVKVDEFPLDNSPGYNATAEEDDLTKKSCGLLKIDSKLLPPSPPSNKIVGGREVVPGEYPWMVAMIRRGMQFCGGSLIDEKNVLTAAHCVEFMNKQDVAALRLRIGDHDIYTNTEANHIERRARRILFHKGFTMKNLSHDIALIHLDRAVQFSKTIQPICLHPGSPSYDTGNMDGDVAGWGTTSSGGSQSSKLLAVKLRIMSNTECNQKYAKAGKTVGPGMVCAGSPGKDSCQGDSGGPLSVDSRNQAKQVGIVSWGIGCADYPGVYTRVDKYMKWINKNKQ